MTHVYLIGIGGSGLSAIARVLLESGQTVSGSDRHLSPLAVDLRAAGVRVLEGHRAENLLAGERPDVVVRSSAIPDDNPEVQAALQAGIPVLKRADFLGQLTGDKHTLAIAGSHGKTTTTAMIAWVLAALGQDPSYIIGGVSLNLGNNAHAGKGEHFVIEADEYDHMFLGLQPHIAVVTNVEHDHPDCYPTPEDFYQAFLAFARRLVPQGLLLACGDDPGASRLAAEARQNGLRTLNYGLHSMYYAYSAHDLVPNSHGGFDAHLALSNQVIPLSLQVPGIHNVLNAVAAVGVADQLGLDAYQAAAALAEYRGTGRRFEVRGQAQGVTVIDDYGHHPTHVRATLAAARTRFPGQAIWAVLQPHTYSRTRALLEAYAAAFADADHVLLTEVYAAREAEPADGFSARQVVAAMRHPDAHFIAGLDETADFLLHRLRAEKRPSGNVVIVFSAGDADQISAQVLQALA